MNETRNLSYKWEYVKILFSLFDVWYDYVITIFGFFPHRINKFVCFQNCYDCVSVNSYAIVGLLLLNEQQIDHLQQLFRALTVISCVCVSEDNKEERGRARVMWRGNACSHSLVWRVNR